MYGRIKSAVVELTIIVTSDSFGYTKLDAIADADEYLAENYPGEAWERIDEELDKYNAWSVRYQRHVPRPNDKRTNGPSWGASE